MGSGKPIEDKVLGSAAAALGIKSSDELAKLDQKGLSGFTQRQLFECAKRLQLKGVSKAKQSGSGGPGGGGFPPPPRSRGARARGKEVKEDPRRGRPARGGREG